MKFQTASQGNLPPPPDTLFALDPLVTERTRFNADRTHRFTLFRHWGDPENYLAMIGMNPSGADEAKLDRTVEKCVRFAQRWQWRRQKFGALYMLNAYSVRETDSSRIFLSAAPSLPENDHWIREVTARAALVVVAWGKPGGIGGRAAEVETILRETCVDRVRCFGRNLDGTPVHPLYQKESLCADDLPSYF